MKILALIFLIFTALVVFLLDKAEYDRTVNIDSALCDPVNRQWIYGDTYAGVK